MALMVVNQQQGLRGPSLEPTYSIGWERIYPGNGAVWDDAGATHYLIPGLLLPPVEAASPAIRPQGSVIIDGTQLVPGVTALIQLSNLFNHSVRMALHRREGWHFDASRGSNGVS